MGLFTGLILGGSVGDPTPRGYVTFDEIRRTAFTSFATQREFADAPSDRPLIVKIALTGDAADADYSKAAGWLAEHVNVRLVEDPRGAPLYLTRENLIATSGPLALGATISRGMAVEVRDEAISPCVLVHEILHFLDLRHVEDTGNIMHGQCGAHKLDKAYLSPEQSAHVKTLSHINAITPAGIETWAYRG